MIGNIVSSQYVFQAQKICKNNSLSKPKNALSAADRFCHKQCSNTGIITNWLMIAAKAGELFKYFQMW